MSADRVGLPWHFTHGISRIDTPSRRCENITLMRTLVPFLTVGCGGFVGSVMRYALSLVGQDAEYLYAAGYLSLTIIGCMASFCAGLYAVSLITKG